MFKVDGRFEFYGDFQINEITDIYITGKTEKKTEKIKHYDLFSVDFGFIGSYSSYAEVKKAMLNCRTLYKVYSAID